MLHILTGSCGAGKTRLAVDMVLSSSRSIYVAPTRALANQFAQWVEEKGVPVVRAFGRKSGENCVNPMLDAAIDSGEPVSSICQACYARHKCDYYDGQQLLIEGNYRCLVTTYHRIAMADSFAIPELLVIDDVISPVILAQRKIYERALSRRQQLSVYHRPSQTWYVLPFLPLSPQTYVLSATPATTLWPLVFAPLPEVNTQDPWGSGVALDQTVRCYVCHLSHRSSWIPPFGSCGFKKNTPPGLPYFLASTGLGDWRGIPIACAGSFQPPLSVLRVFAHMLTHLTGEEHRVTLMPIEIVGETESGRETSIRSAIWGVVNHHLIVDVSSLPSIYPLVQLLGRSGRNIETVYWGDIPLNFRVVSPNSGSEVYVVNARKVIIVAPPSILRWHEDRHRAALVLNGWDSERSLSSDAKKYYRFAQGVLERIISEEVKVVANTNRVTTGPRNN